jgi:hypothetical protein
MMTARNLQGRLVCRRYAATIFEGTALASNQLQPGHSRVGLCSCVMKASRTRAGRLGAMPTALARYRDFRTGCRADIARPCL